MSCASEVNDGVHKVPTVVGERAVGRIVACLLCADTPGPGLLNSSG